MNTNPWLRVALEDYEGHMARPEVGQAALLATAFRNAVESVRPESLALVGCAGGNGLEALVGTDIAPVVCVDINPSYLETLSARYRRKIRGLEIVCGEVERFSFRQPLDLIFGGLIFEYTRLDEALAALSRALRRGGKLIALVQMRSDGTPTVSHSPYVQALAGVGAALNYIEPDAMAVAAARQGLEERARKVITLASGKAFTIVEFERT